MRSPRTPPGPRGLPVVGSLLDYGRDPLGFQTRLARDYGDVVHYTALDNRLYQLNHPDHIEHVLVHNNQNYVKGDLFQRTLGPVTGNGILNSEGDVWRRQRHRIQPAFAPDRIEAYADKMVGATDAALDDWRPGEVRNVHEDVMAITLDIVAEALFGVDLERDVDRIGHALEVVMKQSENVYDELIPPGVPTPSRRRFERAVETLDDVVYRIIDERKRTPTEHDVVSMLLRAEDDDGTRMTDEQLRDEVITLLLAGHETTALALTYTLFLLGQHPAVEARLLAELRDVLGDGGGSGTGTGDGADSADGGTDSGDALRKPALADVPQLEYAERVVKESMRLYPPVHGVIREAVHDDHVGRYTIPAGATVSMNQWVVHRDERWYDDPMAFRPERWTDAFEESLPKLAYFPFAAGPRRCIGDRFAMLEARLVLATVLRRYHLELVSDPRLDLSASITTRPDQPVEFRIRERDCDRDREQELGAVADETTRRDRPPTADRA